MINFYFGAFEDSCHVVIMHFHFTFVLLVSILQGVDCHNFFDHVHGFFFGRQ